MLRPFLNNWKNDKITLCGVGIVCGLTQPVTLVMKYQTNIRNKNPQIPTIVDKESDILPPNLKRDLIVSIYFILN
jgi:hypothetical protein